MLSKDEIVLDSNYVVLIMFVVEVQVFQNPELYTCLVLKFLLVSDYLQSHFFAGFVVQAFYGLSKGSLAEKF